MARRLTSEFWRLCRFGITGLTATLAYAAITLTVLDICGASPIVAAVIGYFAAAIVSYLGHLHFSFDVHPDHKTFLWRFAATLPLAFALTVVLTWLAIGVFHGSHAISVAIVIAVVPAINYLCNRFWVFLPGVAASGQNRSGDSGIAER